MPFGPCRPRRIHEGRTTQEGEGSQGRSEPLLPAHHAEQRWLAEIHHHNRRRPTGRKHATPRAPDGRIDVLYPRGPRRRSLRSEEEGRRTRYRGVLPGWFHARPPQRRKAALLI